MNPRITVKERNLLKGAIRRVFSRSDLRKQVVNASIMEHTDPSRKRVKTWCLCASCNKPTPKSYVQVDHKQPVIAINETFADMSLDEFVDRLWCNIDNLQPICETCHSEKTSLEAKQRQQFKKEKKDGTKPSERSKKTTKKRSKRNSARVIAISSNRGHLSPIARRARKAA